MSIETAIEDAVDVARALVVVVIRLVGAEKASTLVAEYAAARAAADTAEDAKFGRAAPP